MSQDDTTVDVRTHAAADSVPGRDPKRAHRPYPSVERAVSGLSTSYRFPPAFEFSELPAPPEFPGVPAFCWTSTGPPATSQTVSFVLLSSTALTWLSTSALTGT